MSINTTSSRLPTTHFDHDHRERENVSLLAARSLLLQDLRCGPSWGMAMLMRGAWHGIQALGNLSEPKIREARTTGVVHEDIRLVMCKYSDGTRFRTTTYTLEVPMNYIVGVEVAEPLSGVG